MRPEPHGAIRELLRFLPDSRGADTQPCGAIRELLQLLSRLPGVQSHSWMGPFIRLCGHLSNLFKQILQFLLTNLFEQVRMSS